jgi:hypothetical protein
LLLIVSALLGLLAGLVTGGRLRHLLARRLRWPLVVIAAFVVKELLIRTPLAAWPGAPALFALSLVALIAWVVWHRDELPGIWLVAAGIALNLAVVVANGGHMLVAPAAAHLGPHQLGQQGVWAQYAVMGPGTRLDWLGDWILIPRPVGRVFPEAYSPGDVVSAAGLAVVLFRAPRPRRSAARAGAITSR